MRGVGIGLAAIVAIGVSAAAAAECGPTRTGTVASVDERLEPVLADGLRLRLAGVEAPSPTPNDPLLDARARDMLARWLIGRTVGWRPVGAETPDRWGRVAALVVAAPAAAPAEPPEPVADGLLRQGWVRFAPEATSSDCFATWPALESTARAAGLGLWRDSFYAILRGGDRGALAEHAGTNVIVEGHLLAVRPARGRTVLLLDAEGGRVRVRIAGPRQKAFAAAGLLAPAWIGERWRVRGLLDSRFGPEIEPIAPEAIERLPTPSDIAAHEPH